MANHNQGSKKTTLDTTWGNLTSGLNDVFRKQSMSRPRYMELYSFVYDYCTSVTPTANNQPRQQSSGASFVGHELYKKLTQFLDEYLKKLLTEIAPDWSDADVMKFYTTNWNNYQFSCRVMNGIFSYLNRHWIRRETNEGKNAVIYEVYQLALYRWREKLFERQNVQVTDAILSLIEMERNGETITTSLITDVLSSYVELGFDHAEQSNLGIYKSAFEKKFLQQTEQYYRRESEEFLENNTVTEYMKKVETRLGQEQQRVELYLNPSSLPRLMDTCVKVLITDHVDKFYSEFQTLLTHDRKEDLARMYNLLSRNPDSLPQLRDCLKEYIIAKGTEALSARLELASTDAKVYIEIILGQHQRFSELLREAFGNEASFIATLDIAFSQLINKNPVTSKSAASGNGNSNSKSSELLAKYCDQMLKKSNKNCEDFEFEDAAVNVMIIFKYIDEKDVFMAFYTKMLAKRLVSQTSQSDDWESTMISKLKQACGFEYTSKLQRMFQDVSLSRDLNEKFKNYFSGDMSRKLPPIDFQVQVLSSGCWPYTPQNPFTIPKELTLCCDAFHEFYGKQHNSRKLQWLNHMSKGELVTNCFQNKYILQASTYQMAVLLQFNSALSYTINEIATNTEIKMDILTQVVQTLLKAKIVVKDKNADDLEVDENTRINLYTQYRNKKLKININAPIKSEAKFEQQKTHRSIEEDRKHLTQAAIVRIMKARRTLDQSNLISEVTGQLSARFTPNFALIKKCIHLLIEREYLELDKDKKNVYNYLS